MEIEIVIESGPFARRHLPSLLILAAFVLFFINPLYPVGKWSTHLHGGDSISAAYGTNWGAKVLWRSPVKYFEQPLFQPQETPRFFTDLNMLGAALVAPLRFFNRPLLCYNVMMVGIPVVVAFTSYLALFAMTRHRRASLLGAAIFACNGDILYHLWGHPNIAAPVAVLPCIVLYRLFDGKRGMIAACALALALVIQAISSLYHVFILFIGLSFLWLIEWIHNRLRWRTIDTRYWAAIAVACAVVAFFTTPYRNLSARFGQERGLHEATLYSASIAGYLLPDHTQGFPRTIAGHVASKYLTQPRRPENSQFFGYTAWTLAALGVAGAIRRGSVLADQRNQFVQMGLVIGITGFVLSLGPFLWIGSDPTAIPLPFLAIYKFVPPLRFMRATSRFAVLVAACVSISAAVALARAAWFNRGPVWQRFTTFGFLLVILMLEYRPIDVPRFAQVDRGGAELLKSHPDLQMVAPVPISEPQFLLDASTTFPNTPAGCFDGVFNFHYLETTRLLSTFPSDEWAARLAALKVDGVIVYGPDRAQQARALPYLVKLGSWSGGALFRLRYSDSASIAVAEELFATLPERPPLSTDAFPSDVPESFRWIPDNWQWLDENMPPQWQPLQWDGFRGGYRYDRLQKKFYSGLSPRQLSDAARICIRLRLEDPGVDFTKLRVYWLCEGDAGWQSEKLSEVFIRTDGQWQVAIIDLSLNPAYRPHETLTALQFEFTTKPFPGQKLQVDEIRLGTSTN